MHTRYITLVLHARFTQSMPTGACNALTYTYSRASLTLVSSRRVFRVGRPAAVIGCACNPSAVLRIRGPSRVCVCVCVLWHILLGVAARYNMCTSCPNTFQRCSGAIQLAQQYEGCGGIIRQVSCECEASRTTVQRKFVVFVVLAEEFAFNVFASWIHYSRPREGRE